MKRKRIIQFIVGILISVVFLYMVLRSVNFSEVLKALGRARYLYVLYAMLLTVAAFYTRSIRWKYLLHQEKKLKQQNLFAATCVGLMSNNILPFRLGDFVQSYFLGRKENMSRTYIFSTVMLERLFDLLMLLAFFGGASLISSFPVEVKGILFVTIAGFVGIVAVVIFMLYGEKVESIISAFIGCFSERMKTKISGWMNSFISGFQVIKSAKALIRIISLSVIGWILNVMILWLVFIAFGIDRPFPVITIVLTIILISVMIPSSPGYIGTWEYFGVFAMGLFGIDKNLAFSCVLVHHMTQYIPLLVLGLFFIAREGMSLKEVKNISELESRKDG
ncbi:MAG: lysylphosphatidylglycerol synthase transmembrane domain-containing protein [bacterium]